MLSPSRGLVLVKVAKGVVLGEASASPEWKLLAAAGANLDCLAPLQDPTASKNNCHKVSQRKHACT